MSESQPPSVPRKEVIAPAHESIFAGLNEGPLPGERNYGEARLWLVARDPRCLFAYWDFRAEEHPVAAGRDGRALFYLRLLRDGDTGPRTIAVEQGAGNMFIRGMLPDSAYVAELGYFSDGVWCFLAQSPPARTPPELRADDMPVAFATIRADASLREMRRVLAGFARPGESLADTAARIEALAQDDAQWPPAQLHALAQLVGEKHGVAPAPEGNRGDADGSPPAPSRAPDESRIRRRLAEAAIIAARLRAAPVPEEPASPADGNGSPSGGFGRD